MSDSVWKRLALVVVLLGAMETSAQPYPGKPVTRCGMERFAPGKSITAALEAVRETIEQRGLGMCEAGIHGHGLGSLEYPRYRHHALEADQAAIKANGDEFAAGMVFAFNIDLFDPAWRKGETGCVFAETVLITKTGARRMHSYPMEFQTL